MSDVNNQIISSRLVKEIAKFKGQLKNFLTKSAIRAITQKYD
jgi:pantetheine-phosphate adenylyltransferase